MRTRGDDGGLREEKGLRLILLTNRGELVNQILRLSGSHEKECLVEVNLPVTEIHAELCRPST